MYDVLIKEYLKRLSLNDIDKFTLKNGVTLKPGENKIIYDFIMQNWQEVYKGDSKKAFLKLKEKTSKETYDAIIKMFNMFKDKIK